MLRGARRWENDKAVSVTSLTNCQSFVNNSNTRTSSAIIEHSSLVNKQTNKQTNKHCWVIRRDRQTWVARRPVDWSTATAVVVVCCSLVVVVVVVYLWLVASLNIQVIIMLCTRHAIIRAHCSPLYIWSLSLMYHRLNGSSSSVLTATPHSYVLLYFSPTDLEATPQPIFTQNVLNAVDPRTDVPFAVKIETFSNHWPPGPENCQNLALFGTWKIFARFHL